jgi:hypothetical protein
MEAERFVDIRVQTVRDYENYIERVKHNTRYKKEKRVVNSKGFINEFGENVEGVKSEYAQKTLGAAQEDFEKIRAEHKELDKQNFRDRRTKSIAEGILYFSKGINQDLENNQEDFKARLKEMLKNFEDEKKTKVLSYQIHLDERGNAHVHFFFKNFDRETGKSLNFTRSKRNGEWIQDLAHKHFGSFGKGYQRGIKKERSEKYLNIEEYKMFQESKKQLLNAQKELEHTKGLNEELKQDNELLRADNEQLSIRANDLQKETDEMRRELLALSLEFQELINDFEGFILEESEKEKLNKLKSLFVRYSKNENAERMLNSIEKGRKQLKRVKDKYTRKSNRL